MWIYRWLIFDAFSFNYSGVSSVRRYLYLRRLDMFNVSFKWSSRNIFLPILVSLFHWDKLSLLEDWILVHRTMSLLAIPFIVILVSYGVGLMKGASDEICSILNINVRKDKWYFLSLSNLCLSYTVFVKWSFTSLFHNLEVSDKHGSNIGKCRSFLAMTRFETVNKMKEKYLKHFCYIIN